MTPGERQRRWEAQDFVDDVVDGFREKGLSDEEIANILDGKAKELREAPAIAKRKEREAARATVIVGARR